MEDAALSLKKFFFMLQTFYPCFFVVFFIVFMIIFFNYIQKNKVLLMDKLSADWHNTAYTYQEFNYGSSSSLPFNDLIVVDAKQ